MSKPAAAAAADAPDAPGAAATATAGDVGGYTACGDGAGLTFRMVKREEMEAALAADKAAARERRLLKRCEALTAEYRAAAQALLEGRMTLAEAQRLSRRLERRVNRSPFKH